MSAEWDNDFSVSAGDALGSHFVPSLFLRLIHRCSTAGKEPIHFCALPGRVEIPHAWAPSP